MPEEAPALPKKCMATDLKVGFAALTWTVALGMKHMEAKSFSLKLKRVHKTKRKTANTRIKTPEMKGYDNGRR